MTAAAEEPMRFLHRVEDRASNALLVAEAARKSVAEIEKRQVEWHRAVHSELQSLRGDVAEIKGQADARNGQLLKALVPKVMTWITAALIPTLATAFIGVYIAVSKATAQSREQAAVVAQATVDDSEGRDKRLIREAIAEARASWNQQLEAARIEEMRRQTAAERAASMRAPQ